MTVGTRVLSCAFRLNIPSTKKAHLKLVEATVKNSAPGSKLEIDVVRRHAITESWESIFDETNLEVQAGDYRGQQSRFAISLFYLNDDIDIDIITNGGADNCSVSFLWELI